RASRAGAPPRGRHPAADDDEGSGGRAVTGARLLPRRSVADLARRGAGVDAKTLAAAARIVEAVRKRGEVALRKHAERLGDVSPGAPLYHNRADLARALAGLSPEERTRLERVAARIRAFAVAQRGALGPVRVPVPGGIAEHRIAPIERAGCYAPGGRYPLPSSVLMTAVTARVAGVRDIWVASPKPQGLTLAAAAIAGADGVLAVGGAQAIAALAYGTGPIAPRDVIVGPGNRYVAAAKRLVAGAVAIDMLAGPSELVVFADSSADAATVAVDLLAQAEHDPHAVPMLVTTAASATCRPPAWRERHWRTGARSSCRAWTMVWPRATRSRPSTSSSSCATRTRSRRGWPTTARCSSARGARRCWATTAPALTTC